MQIISSKKLPALSLLLISLLLIPSQFLQAQNSGNEDQTKSQNAPSFSGFSQLNVPGSYSGFFYVDELGLKLSTQLTTFESSLDQKTYRLGPNDILTVDVQGSISMMLRGMVINSQGDLVIPNVGNVNISGISIDSAETKLENRFNKIYDTSKVDLTLDKPRSIQVHVSGDISKPGKFTFPAQTRVSEVVGKVIGPSKPAPVGPAINNDQTDVSVSGRQSGSAVNTNSQSGTSQRTVQSNQGNTGAAGKQSSESVSEPKDSFNRNYLTDKPYSLRNIVIKRRDGSKDTADLVSYFATGNLADNPYIKDGDQINLYKLTRWSPRVSVSGAVVSPIETEFKTNESISELIEIAGGFSADADTTHINVFRKFDQNVHKITVRHADYGQFTLKPNDRVVVPTLRSGQATQTATVNGEVANPGKYPVVEGETTVYDLLKMAGNLTKEALARGGYLTRSAHKDQFEQTEPTEKREKFNISLLKRSSMQTIEGFEYLSLESTVSKGHVPIDFSDTTQLKQIKIYDGDKLYIPRNHHTVFVFGQVNNPGYYPFNQKTSAEEYIRNAGGFSLPAEPKEIFVIKAGSRSWIKPSNTNIGSGDMIFVNRKPYMRYTEKRNLSIQTQQLKNDSLRLALQEKQQRNDTIRLVLTGISTITGFITTYLIITR